MSRSVTDESKKLWATLSFSCLLGWALNLAVLYQIPIWACRLNNVIGYTCGGDVNLAWGMGVAAIAMILTSLTWFGLHAIAIGKPPRVRGLTFLLAVMVACLPYLHVVWIIGVRIGHPTTELFHPDFDRSTALLRLRDAKIALAVQMLIWPVLPLIASLRLPARN